ncbi:MAG: hypothetical protein WC686_05530, partial [Candidatus Shapirobacteria bacterium]
MNSSETRAIIYGIENFTAQKMVEELVNKSIEVIGIGTELPNRLASLRGFSFRNSLEEAREEASYYFDFVGEDRVWEKAKKEGSRLAVVKVNQEREFLAERNQLREKGVNWRWVEMAGVYGKNMPVEGFLAEAFLAAAGNKNMILPTVGNRFRVLAVDDAVEAILRACFLSGTEGEEFWVMGQETESEEVARVMIEEAKMTRFKVMQKDIALDQREEEEVERHWGKLRWRPKMTFQEGAKETMQYFLSKVDEENRKGVGGETKKGEAQKADWGVKKSEDNRRKFEVLVEEKETVAEEEAKEVDDEPAGKEPEPVQEIDEVVWREPKEEEEDDEEDEIVEQAKVEIIRSEARGRRNEDLRRQTVKAKWKWLVWPIVAMTLLMLWWPVGGIVAGWRNYKNIIMIEKKILAKEYSQVEELADRAWKSSQEMDATINDWGINNWKWGRYFQMVIRIEKEAAMLGRKAAGLASNLDNVNEAIFKEKEIEFEKELEKIKIGLDEVEVQMGVLQARLNGDWTWLPTRFRNWPQKGARQLASLKQVVGWSKNGIEVMPEILGLDGKKRE